MALLWAGLFMAAAAHAASFEITDASPRFGENLVLVSARMDLELSEDTQTALNKGIPLKILIEFVLKRERKWMWDKKVGNWVLRAEIKYHALSGLYSVRLQDESEVKTFSSQQGALKYVGTLSRVSLPLIDDSADDNRSYWLDLRVRLDLSSLPTPLRLMAYTSSQWWLKSKWTRWAVER
jgi:hypothetical protein